MEKVTDTNFSVLELKCYKITWEISIRFTAFIIAFINTDIFFLCLVCVLYGNLSFPNI